MQEQSSFGALLKRYRLAAGLSQEALAARARLSARAISDLERGIKHRPHFETLDLLTDALSLSAQQRALLHVSARPEMAPAPSATRWASSLSSLPLAPTPLIGREQEVQSIQALLLRPDMRLLTLIGTAGVGKTRLALEVARGLVHDFADGVSFVSLAPLSDPTFVIPTIAHSIGLIESGSQPLLERLKTSQRDKHRLLLLDNFEHVIEASPLLAELLEACSQLKLLVTSREVLRLRGEHQFVVPPLALPDPKRLPDVGSLAHVPAVHLFIQRAQAIRADFHVTTDNAAAIADICLRLDGLPLAIELAAARIKVLAPQALLARLDHRLHVLTGGAGDLPERQHALRNTITWSYELLDAAEQRLFRLLSVFVGGCTLEAAEAVCGALDETDRAMEVLDGMASLLDKSLLQQVEKDGQEPRFLMLETVREYGLERLTDSGELKQNQQAHALYYLALAEQAEQDLEGPQQLLWLELLEREHDNLRATLGWLLEHGQTNQCSREMALRLGAGLENFWVIRGHIREGRSVLERALATSEGVASFIRAKALNVAADLALCLDDDDQAEILAEESLVLFRGRGDHQGIALARAQIGAVKWRRGNLVVARSLLEEALVIFKEAGNRERSAFFLSNLAVMAIQQAEYARARALLEESLVIYRELGDKQNVASSLCQLAHTLFLSQSDQAVACSLLEEALPLLREVGDKADIGRCLSLFGAVSLQLGDAARARSLAEESLAFHREMGYRWDTAESLSILARVKAYLGDHAAARVLYEEALTIAREIGNKLNIASDLEGLGITVLAQGEPAWAVRLWGAAEAVRQHIGAPLPPVYRADYERSVATARVQLSEKAFAAAWAEGRNITPEQALAAQGPVTLPQSSPAAPSSTPQAKSSTTSPGGLSVRELEVLRLLATGLTDAQIAEHLVLSLHTIHAHLRTIYSKLGVTSRSAATRYAFEHQLV